MIISYMNLYVYEFIHMYAIIVINLSSFRFRRERRWGCIAVCWQILRIQIYLPFCDESGQLCHSTISILN